MLKRSFFLFLLFGACLGLHAATPTSSPSNTPIVSGTETQTPTYTPTVSFTPSCGGPILQWSGIVCSTTASTSMNTGFFNVGPFTDSLLLVRVECGSGVLPSSIQLYGAYSLLDSGSHVPTYAGGILATYYLVQPATLGEGYLSLSFPSSGEHLNIEVEIYSSVNPVNPIGAISSASGNSQIFSTNVTTLSSGSVIDDFLAIQNVYSNNEMSSTGSGQSSAGDLPGCCEEVYGDNKLAGAEGAYSMTYDLSQSVPYTSQLIEIEANNCGTPTRTPTLSPSFTISASPTSTFIVSSTSTPSVTPPVTGTLTSTQTNTPLPVTGTLTATPTDTPTATVTNVGGSATSTPTESPTATITSLPVTGTQSPTPTETETITPYAGTPTSTETYTPLVVGTATSTETHTPLVAGTPTSTETYTPLVVGTATSTETHTPLVAGTPTSTETYTPLVVGTATSTPTYTPLVAGTPTSTPTVTSGPSSGTSTPVVQHPSPVISPVPVHRMRICNNPFRPMQGELITICFDDNNSEPIEVLIYSRQGHLIQTLNVQANTGTACVSWDGRDSRGAFAPSGIFLVEIKGNQWFTTGKLVLVK